MLRKKKQHRLQFNICLERQIQLNQIEGDLRKDVQVMSLSGGQGQRISDYK